MTISDPVLAIVLGIVEGLTEFLPVSSTAHIRLAQSVLAGEASLSDNFWKLFAVLIQLPAVLAVVVYFWPQIVKFVKSFFHGGLTLRKCYTHPVALVMIGTVVTAIPAALAKKLIDKNLESVAVMGYSLIIGGLIMGVVDLIYGTRERRLLSTAAAAAEAGVPTVPSEVAEADRYEATPHTHPPIVTRLEEMKPWQAVWIGAVQILSAVFPGTSRSMSTIAAGQLANLTRAAALEYSFFMSIPIMFAACLFDLRHAIKPGDELYVGHRLTPHECMLLGIGSIVSFLVALAVIAWFMAWVRRRGFVPFAVYRVIIGVVVLLYAYRLIHIG
ncbi:MAG: undecaprenyl-diphosphate phosphatase [Tepidisphaeraceae bacterium]